MHGDAYKSRYCTGRPRTALRHWVLDKLIEKKKEWKLGLEIKLLTFKLYIFLSYFRIQIILLSSKITKLLGYFLLEASDWFGRTKLSQNLSREEET